MHVVECAVLKYQEGESYTVNSIADYVPELDDGCWVSLLFYAPKGRIR
jgi:hypothetical protein